MGDGVASEASTSIMLAEDFAQFARETVEPSCAVVLLLPWSTGIAPDGIVAPPARADANRIMLTAGQVAGVLAHCDTLLVPCTFDTEAEVAAGERIMAQFHACPDLLVVFVHLFADSAMPGREANQTLIDRENLMFHCGACDVIQDPGSDAEELRSGLKAARTFWRMDKQRIRAELSQLPEGVSAEHVNELQRQKRQLLWEGIPNVLMPKMQPIRRNLLETGKCVGSFTYLHRYSCVQGGMVLKAHDAEKDAVRVIKIVEKSNTYHPEEVEDVYREFVFLSHILEHPNIVRIVDMMHSQARVYLVFEFAGDKNMVQTLQGTLGQRFADQEALVYFDQLLGGLAFCHSKKLAHRSVCMEHLAVDAGRRLRLLDFRAAVITKGQHVSRTICGRLPCIVPQMATGKAYQPRLADSWSAGMVLLEMSAGLHALSCAIPYDREKAQACLEAPRIHSFFEQHGSHEAALSCRGAIPTNRVLAMTQVLLVPNESGRIEVQQLFRTRQPAQADQADQAEEA